LGELEFTRQETDFSDGVWQQGILT